MQPETQTTRETLQPVDVGPESLARYYDAVGYDSIDELQALAEPLRGARVAHINATSYGGGVSELLRSIIPLYRAVGVAADWLVIPGSPDFFDITKGIHNALQGAPYRLTEKRKELYVQLNQQAAEALGRDYDYVVVHDPQPAAMRSLHGGNDARWVWRCHIDTSEPNAAVWNFLRPYLEDYEAAVFTLGGFVPPDFPATRIEIMPPAIDPESPKNIEIGDTIARRMLGWLGVESDRPLMTQVSRFDPWKDPFGVIEVWRLVRAEVPDLQLALVGSMALDDPEGWELYERILEARAGDLAFHVFTNLTGVSNTEVNAFQRLSDVVLQKSIREGFGLVVSETLWKGTPVVAGRAGGIPMQLRDGTGGFLIDSVEEAAERALQLLRDPDLGRELGARGRELVRDRFLLPRLIADELRLYAALLDLEAPMVDASLVGLTGERRDPVCGLRVPPGREARTAEHAGSTLAFCSEDCHAEFEADPARFGRAISPRGGSTS